MSAGHAPWRTATLAALFGLLLALVVFAPARWLGMALESASGGRVLLVNPRGTLWTGEADLLLTGGPGSRDQAALPQGVRWKLLPTWSQGPALRLVLQAPCCAPQGLSSLLRPVAGGVEWTLASGQSRWPAAVLAGLGTPWNTLQLQARLAFQTPGLQWALSPGRPPQGQGSATLDVVDAASRVSTVRPLGSYRLQLDWPARGTDTADSPKLTLTTLQGSLLLSGEGQWVAGRLRFSGEAQAASGREDALNNLMNLLGRRSNGRTLIKIG